jgi:hypothetical protein
MGSTTWTRPRDRRAATVVHLKPPRNSHECTITVEHRIDIAKHVWSIHCHDCDPSNTRCIYYLDEAAVKSRAIRHEQGQGDDPGTVMTL